MRAPVVLSFVAIAICLAPVAPIVAQNEAPVEQAIKLVNQGNVDRGIELLQGHLKGHPNDVNGGSSWAELSTSTDGPTTRWRCGKLA